MPQPDRTLARRLAAESLARGDAVGWFETLYRAAGDNAATIPWADLGVNPSLAEWFERQPASQANQPGANRALVVGCGLGDDAEFLAARGFAVTAFDVSATAVQWCRKRFGQSEVSYVAADLLAPPAEWRGGFDFVFEAYTLQVLPPEVRPQAVRSLVEFLAPGGMLLVIARAREPGDEAGTMPWPLTRDDLAGFAAGLEVASFEDYFDAEDPPVRRFRAEYRRPR
jgi:SAM-dependent methyltransferase